MYVDVSHTADIISTEDIRAIFSYRYHLLEKTEIKDRRKGISKIIIEGVTSQTRPRDVYGVSGKYDICELYISSQEHLFRCAQWQINCVQLDMTKDLPIFNKGSISSVAHAGIYFSINMEVYENPQTRRAWIYNVKDLLRLCSKKMIVLSFGKSKIDEEEVQRIFERFEIKRSVSKKFYTTNIENMLIKAAVKKYAYKGVIVPIESQETEFKQMVYKANK